MLTAGDGGGGPRRPSRPPSSTPGTHFVRSGGGSPRPPAPSYSPPPSYGYRPPPAPVSHYRPSPSQYNPPSPSRTGGGGGGGGGQSGGGKPKPKPKPKAPSIGKYLKSDEQYQRDRAGLIRNFRNLKEANIENRVNVKEDKGTTLNRLSREQEESLKAMQDDFAARGLFGGAEYLNKENDFNLDFLEKRTDAKESYRRNIAQLLRDLQNAGTLKDENLQQARLEAIRRRAAEFGIRN